MTIVSFVQGAVAMGCGVAGMFFLRFWRRSGDRLFFHFAAAFWVLAVSYVLLGTAVVATEWRVSVFVIRLLAFCLILYAVFDKNRPSRSSSARRPGESQSR